MPSAVVRVKAYLRKVELALNAARKERCPAEERTAIKKLLAAAHEDLARVKAGGQSQIPVDPPPYVLELAKRAPANAPRLTERLKVANAKPGREAKRRKAPRSTAMPKARQLPPSRIDRIGDFDSGVRFAQDPDAGTRRVWAFKSGHSFDSGDCHLVQARDGAVRIPLSEAKMRGLERCMHCAPTVR